MDLYFQASSIEHQKREKVKAQNLRASQWWKNQLGRSLCYHCEGRFHPSELTMDHLMPIARGGRSEKTNVVPSCKDCNTKKGYKTRAEIVLEALKLDSDS
jgi:5-methylcytosine-specific restriction protein A